MRGPHSTNFKVENGKKLGAYLAGEMYGCYTHRTFATQPCVASITDDEMPCALCQGGLVADWRGYVPLWDCDWTLHHALINEDYFETVNAIPFRAKVSVSRGKNPISPLVIREEPMLTRELPNRAPWNASVVMLQVCLTLWKNPDLARWCEEHRLLAMGPTTPTEAPVPARVKELPPAVVKPYTGPGEPKPVSEDLDTVGNRIKKKLAALPSANGDHKPKK